MYFGVNNKLPFVYLEMGKLRIQSSQLAFENSLEVVSLPGGRFSTIFMGPGTTVTEGAIKQCMKTKCLIVWCGEDITKCYAMLPIFNQSSDNLTNQINLYTKKFDKLLKRYFEIRFNRPLVLIGSPTPEKIRGIEGAYMKKLYIEYAKKYGIPYSGRMREDSWDKNTVYNKAISICNSLLYGMCCSVLVSLGYSPSLGLLHKGDMLSLVYDIADIYKPIFSIPLGFELAKDINDKTTPPEIVDKEIRKRALGLLMKLDIINKTIIDIGDLFNDNLLNKKYQRNDKKVTINVSL